MFADPEKKIFKPRIVLPKMDTSQLDKRQKITLSALLVHESLHHTRTHEKDYNPDKKESSRLLKDLVNCLEDARIEIDKNNKWILPGCQQDLHSYRRDKFIEISSKSKEEMKLNKFGFILMGYKFSLPGYGDISLPKEIQYLYDIGWEVIKKNNKFYNVSLMGKEGTKTIYKIAKEIVEKWKEEQEKREEQNPEEEYKEAQENIEIQVLIESLHIDISKIADEQKKGLINEEKFKIEEYKEDYDPYIPYTDEDKEIKPEQDINGYQEIRKATGPKVSMMRRKLNQILMMESTTIVERGFRSGNIDPRLYYKVIKNSKRIKTQVVPGRNFDVAISLLLDMSGSMFPDKSRTAAEIANLFGETLSVIPQISFEILGYNSAELKNETFKSLQGKGYVRAEALNYWIFKEFKEKWTLCRNRLGSCVKHTTGCNCDHEHLVHAAERLFNQPQKNKIMIVICDGHPSGYHSKYLGKLARELKNTIQKIRKSGIKLFCYGIKSPGVKKFYDPDCVIIESLEHFDEMALTQLGKFLLKGS
jgi:hypothetical protein